MNLKHVLALLFAFVLLTGCGLFGAAGAKNVDALTTDLSALESTLPSDLLAQAQTIGVEIASANPAGYLAAATSIYGLVTQLTTQPEKDAAKKVLADLKTLVTGTAPAALAAPSKEYVGAMQMIAAAEAALAK